MLHPFAPTIGCLLASALAAAYPSEPFRAHDQDLYTNCNEPVIGQVAGRLNGRALFPVAEGSPVLCVGRNVPAPDGAGEDGVLCRYEPVGNADAWGHRQRDGSVQIEVEGKVPTAGWHHVALVRRARRGTTEDLVYEFVACRPFGMVAQVISKVHARLKITDPPDAAFVVVIDSGSGQAIVKVAAKLAP